MNNAFLFQASERKLAPLKKESTLRELLMESIKKPPKPLRSTRTGDSSILQMKVEKSELENYQTFLKEWFYETVLILRLISK